MQEAWEEAGVRAVKVTPKPVGHYTYDKVMKDGAVTPIEAAVYTVHVSDLADIYPEHSQRERRWFEPAEAATRVAEPKLRTILRNIEGCEKLPSDANSDANASQLRAGPSVSERIGHD
jgi:8-oxo-dGTP pyrophosphatase MutT (NUDIX family)